MIKTYGCAVDRKEAGTPGRPPHSPPLMRACACTAR
jgi:hypothetical protein